MKSLSVVLNVLLVLTLLNSLFISYLRFVCIYTDSLVKLRILHLLIIKTVKFLRNKHFETWALNLFLY